MVPLAATGGSEQHALVLEHALRPLFAVARLRTAAARYPRDPSLRSLLAELRAGSEEFTAIWDTNPMRVPGHRTKTMVHPDAGPLRVHCDI
ncbi:MAG: hypothetical protein ACRDNW_09450, partial [Trebonia sp.]